MLLIGLDLCEIDRFARISERFPRRLLRIFTEEELSHAQKRGRGAAASYAAFWAAREAAVKALGSGFTGGVSWRDASVSFTASGAPRLILSGTLAKKAAALGVTDISLSLTHEKGMAAAVVVMGGNYANCNG